MPYINVTMLMGHLGKDAEQKFTPSGISVTNFSIATTRRWKADSGEAKEKTDWHNIVAWRLPESIPPMLKKGSLVLVSGRLETRSYEKDGKKIYVTEVIADIVQHCREANATGAPARNLRPAPDEEEEIPWS